MPRYWWDPQIRDAVDYTAGIMEEKLRLEMKIWESLTEVIDATSEVVIV